MVLSKRRASFHPAPPTADARAEGRTADAPAEGRAADARAAAGKTRQP